METLKISDLSVGDWVEFRGNICTIRSTFQAAGDVPDEVVLSSKNNYLGVAPVSELRPILITAEILGKNGWTSDEMCAEMRITEYSHLEYYFREHRLREWVYRETGWLPGEVVTSIAFTAHCYSVHQLQHALRLAGVDKEINL